MAKAGDVTTIDVNDVIGGWGINARSFRETLKGVKTGTINLRVNSPGGLVFDGIAMYNDLLAFRKAGGKVNVEVTGLAASAASLLVMAGNTIAIADNAFLMIHNAWVGVIGNKAELNKQSEVLAKIDAALARTYSARSGMAPDEVAQMMDDETWMDAEKAVDLGFADKTLAAAKAALSFDLSAYVNVPAVLETSAKVAADEVQPQAEDLSQLVNGIRQLTASVKGFLNDASTPTHQAA